MDQPKPEPSQCQVIPGSVASFPVLVHHRKDNAGQTLYSISDHTSRAGDIPEIIGRYLATSRGWILVLGPLALAGALEAFLWDPQSGERIQLPDMEMEEGDEVPKKNCCCLLSHDVASPDCGVLVYDHAAPDLWYCRVNGGGGWVQYWYDIGTRDVPEV